MVDEVQATPKVCGVSREEALIIAADHVKEKHGPAVAAIPWLAAG
jgi:hypothetical protein